MSDGVTFGSYIREKRINLEPYISLRKMAELLKLSPVHMSNIETGRDAAPKNEILANLAQLLKLDKQEQEYMYDLAAESKNYIAVPYDLTEYISENERARVAMRVAKDVDATDTEWNEFIAKLKKRSHQQEE